MVVAEGHLDLVELELRLVFALLVAGDARSFFEKRSAVDGSGGEGTLLDNTTVVWTNELGKGNSHTRNDVPFALFGGGLGFTSGRSLRFERQPHNRLLLSFAHAFGHKLDTFGNPRMCEAGPLDLA